ncbi:MAG TPA: indolepyruvate oxidoreductase subunit beta [Desulfuromonadales bacterium]|nr:indolepyruvate oxidoreductase subunit beta [Desulfuromonadales bacterium]
MKNDGITNILMAGVGGQGTLLASEILSEVLMQAGYDVKKAEVHGMAQRGGSVVSHVRFGPKVYSAIIPEGGADILFGFELLESYRYLPLLAPQGTVVVNNLRIAPPSVALGRETYPRDIPDKLRQRVADVRLVDGLQLAEQAGDPRTVNTVLLGALSNLLDPSPDQWLAAIKALVPERFQQVNLEAFDLGRAAKA